MSTTKTPPPTERLSDAERERRWLDDRKTAMTATDAAAVIGVSKFATPIDVWLEKTGQSVKSEPTEQQESGNRLQRPILEWYGDRKQVPIVFADAYQLVRAKETPLIGATLDAYHASDLTPVDAKNIGYPQPGDWGDDGTDQIPLYYAVQLVVQMYVTASNAGFHHRGNPDFARLAVLFRGQELRVYEVRRDKQLEQDIIARMLDFHAKHVVADTPPPIDGTSAWTDYIKRKFASNTDRILNATPELHEAAVMLHSVRSQIKALDEKKTLIENNLKYIIGDAKTLRGTNWSATHSKTKDGTEVDYMGALKSLALKFSSITGEPFTEHMQKAIDDNTKPKPGYKRFTFTFTDE